MTKQESMFLLRYQQYLMSVNTTEIFHWISYFVRHAFLFFFSSLSSLFSRRSYRSYFHLTSCDNFVYVDNCTDKRIPCNWHDFHDTRRLLSPIEKRFEHDESSTKIRCAGCKEKIVVAWKWNAGGLEKSTLLVIFLLVIF